MAIENHPNYTTIQTFVKNTTLLIQNEQAKFFTKHKHYFQGLKIPATGKLDGIEEIQIQYGLKPDDQPYSWNDFDSKSFKVNIKFPVHVSIDVYTSSQGPGWILKFEFWYEEIDPDGYGNKGNHWFYQHNEGPLKRPGIWDEWFIMIEGL